MFVSFTLFCCVLNILLYFVLNGLFHSVTKDNTLLDDKQTVLNETTEESIQSQNETTNKRKREHATDETHSLEENVENQVQEETVKKKLYNTEDNHNGNIISNHHSVVQDGDLVVLHDNERFQLIEVHKGSTAIHITYKLTFFNRINKQVSRIWFIYK
jgi:hypothetical protein